MMLYLKRFQRSLLALLIVFPWYALFINMILLDIRRVTEYGYAILLGVLFQVWLTRQLWWIDRVKPPMSKVFISVLLGLIVLGSFLVHYIPLRLL